MALAPRRSLSMNRMWDDFHATFPLSETAQDGWIGDAAHQAESSGHNPDDTTGVKAERSDVDSIPEVRAIDKDNRLHDTHGVTLQQVIDRMLITPNDLKRLIYIIHKGHIWSASSLWLVQTYTGSDPHELHAHFSGGPDFDDDASEWTSITYFKENSMSLNEWTAVPPSDPAKAPFLTQGSAGYAGQQRDTALAFAWQEAGSAHTAAASTLAQSKSNGSGISELKTAIAAISTGGVTQEMLNIAVKAALLDPDVHAALVAASFEGAQQAERE